MTLAAADLIEGAPPPPNPGGRSATLDLVTAWLNERRPTPLPAVPSCTTSLRRDWIWGVLALVAAPMLWPDALKALWQGEPVWNHLQKQAGWFQVVETMLLDTGTGKVRAQAARAWRCIPPNEPSLEELLSLPLQNGPKQTAAGTMESDQPVTVLVGRRSRLAVRTLGYPPEALREALQAICDEADSLLEEPLTTQHNQQRLLQALLKKTLFRSGPRAAPWNTAGALRFIGLLSLGFAGLAALVVHDEMAWQLAIAKLDAEPGIRITDSEVRWGVRHIEGLRDGMSAEPAEVLRSFGHPLDHVEFHLDTVVYRESSAINRQILSPPAP